MLRAASQRGLRPNYVLFANWYASRSILNLLEELNWIYIARIKSNRLLDGESIRHKWKHRFGQATGHLKRVDEVVRIIKDGRRYWVTNDLNAEPSQVKKHYRMRQQIEERSDY